MFVFECLILYFFLFKKIFCFLVIYFNNVDYYLLLFFNICFIFFKFFVYKYCYLIVCDVKEILMGELSVYK